MIHHVAHQVPSSAVETCVDFYRLLGFEPVVPPASLAGRARWLQRGPTQIHLIGGADGGGDIVHQGAGHVAIIVDRYDETLAELRRRGHPVDPRQQHWGSPRAYVRDPAGHLVELIARPPGE